MRKEKAAWVLTDGAGPTDQCGDVAVFVLNRQSQERDVFPLIEITKETCFVRNTIITRGPFQNAILTHRQACL